MRYEFDIDIDQTFTTSGDGHWSELCKPVRCTRIYLNYVDDDIDVGEIHVCFDTATWNTEHDSLIYTDKNFRAELIKFLTDIGLDATDVGYSEYGMQGDDYVSLDVGPKFLNSV